MHNTTAATAGRLVSRRYRLHEPIGRGAMGTVWRGRDELLDRDVAVKEVRAAADNTDTYQRTLREAKAAARLNHPGVVTVFDVVEEDGSPWIVMELVHARSLDRLLAEDGPLRPVQAARLGQQLLGALDCAHASGVLHRDVKPGNVLVADDGAVKLTDFGIATYPGDPALTQAGMVYGTPGYTAPERVRGEPASPASDLWSLGTTLYTAVEGRGPFGRPGGSAAMFAAVAHEPAPRAPSAGPLGPVIDALLRADPAQRPDVATAARLLGDAVAQTGSEPLFPGGLAVPGGGPAFADVREFPHLPPPADLPVSADLPEFLDQPAAAVLNKRDPAGIAGAASRVPSAIARVSLLSTSRRPPRAPTRRMAIRTGTGCRSAPSGSGWRHRSASQARRWPSSSRAGPAGSHRHRTSGWWRRRSSRFPDSTARPGRRTGWMTSRTSRACPLRSAVASPRASAQRVLRAGSAVLAAVPAPGPPEPRPPGPQPCVRPAAC